MCQIHMCTYRLQCKSPGNNYRLPMFYMTTLSVLGVLGCRQNDNRQKPRIIHVPCTISTLFVYVDYSKSAVEIN